MIDASVAAKWFFDEEHSREARALLGTSGRHVAPDFIRIEIANVAAQRVRRGGLITGDGQEACRRLPTMLRMHDTSVLVTAALEIAMTFDRSVYDSLYVALASLLKRPLITADRRLYNALVKPLPETMLWIGDVTAA